MKKITIRPNGTTRVTVVNTEKSRTQAHFAEQCDVNNIVKKYKVNGFLSHTHGRQGVYGDFSNVTDYQTALQTVIDAQNGFMTLPASVRKKFENDPQQLLTFLSDPKNAQEAFDLGLTKTNPSLSQTLPPNSPQPSPKRDEPNDAIPPKAVKKSSSSSHSSSES